MNKLLCLLLISGMLRAQKNYPALLDAYMIGAVSVNQFSGSVLVAKNGNILYQKTFGTLDIKNEHLLDTNSMFELGIICEEFTAAAVLKLQEIGKLKLSDPITKWLPELPYSNVTIKHLLTHCSGIPDYYDEAMTGRWGHTKAANNEDVVRMLAAVKPRLKWIPGTKYNEHQYYTEYPLLACVIERISGQSYGSFMQAHFFTPLHLHHTKVFTDMAPARKENPGHTESIYFDELKQQFFAADSIGASPEYLYSTESVVGGRGISSTTHDLYVWNQAFIHHQFLSRAAQRQMITPWVLKDSLSKIYMGYGFLVGQNEFGNYFQQRDFGNNETLGYSTMLIHYLQKDITIIVLANKAKPSSNIAGPLTYIMHDQDIVTPYIHKEIDLDSTILDSYTGNYEVPYPIGVYRKKNTLWMTMEGEPDLKLLAESGTKFFSASKEYDLQLEFTKDAFGKLLHAFIINNGLKKEMRRTGLNHNKAVSSY